MKLVTPQAVSPTTFTRSTAATYVGSNGLIQTAAINEPRPNYVSGILRGQLLESAATNLLLQSQFVSGWTANAATTTFNATGVLSPDGTTNGRTVNDTSAAVGGYVYQSVSFTAGTTYTMSVYVKKGVSTYFQIKSFTQTGFATFNLSTNTVEAVSGIVSSATITPAANGWYRCTATMTATATASNNVGYSDFEAAPTGDLFSLYGAQIEAGTSATSYIPTVASTVTRAADVQTGYGLTYSNIPQTDAANWVAGTYTLGQKVIYNYRVYEVIVSTTTDQPDVGAAKTTPTWRDNGAINRYKMFDEVISTGTTGTPTIAVVISPGQLVNALALFNLTATTVQVTVNDPVEGLVYNETQSLQDNTLITSWYNYFFEAITNRSDAIFDDLPSYASGILSVVISNGASNAICGELVIGKQQTLGVSNFGSSVSIQDYSIKTRDEFGNTIIQQRAYSKQADFDVTVETPFVAAVQRILSDIRTTPTVFIGDADRSETVVYGFYRSFDIVLDHPSISSCAITVEGLV
jgi:hypothetical protein